MLVVDLDSLKQNNSVRNWFEVHKIEKMILQGLSRSNGGTGKYKRVSAMFANQVSDSNLRK
jgi:hypothetical protein